MEEASSSSTSHVKDPTPAGDEHDPAERISDPLLYNLPPFPQSHLKKGYPALFPPDTNAIFAETFVDGVKFAAMITCGEPKIPLSQFVTIFTAKYPNYCLDEFSGEYAVQHLIAEMNFHLYHISPEAVSQLRAIDESLFQEPAANFQLITVSNAHHVLSKMRIESSDPPRLSCTNSMENAFFRVPIQHTMCGDFVQSGYLYPKRKGGRCIECGNCGKFFTAPHFVMHSHTSQEETLRTVHWGLSDDCWRYALYMSEEAKKCEEWVKAFDEFMEDAIIEDEFYPPWFSKKNKEENMVEPTKKKSRVIEVKEEYFEADPKLTKILENVTVLSSIPCVKVDEEMLEHFNKTEARLREKVTAEAMQGSLFDNAKPISAEEAQQRAAQIIRSQNVHVPDPESFPKNVFDTGFEDIQTLISTINLLQTLPDSTSNPAIQSVLTNMAATLLRHAQRIAQQQHVYAALLGAYKTVNLLYRAHTDPSQPMPDGQNFDEIRRSLVALDRMGMVSPVKKPEGYIEPEFVNSIVDNYIRNAILLQNISPKTDLPLLSANPFSALATNPAFLSNLLNNGKNGFNGLNGLNGLNGHHTHHELSNGKKHSLQEDIPSTSKSHTQLSFNNLLGLTPFSLISPAMKLGPEVFNEELTRALTARHFSTSQ